MSEQWWASVNCNQNCNRPAQACLGARLASVGGPVGESQPSAHGSAANKTGPKALALPAEDHFRLRK
jgi:hypothetical protein